MLQLHGTIALGLASALGFAGAAEAGFVVYGGDGSAWFEAVADHSVITFAEFPQNTPISDQYAHLGVLFTDTDGNWILGTGGPNSFLQDGIGLNGNAIVEMTFDSPMWAFASWFPGIAFFDFYLGDELVFASPMFGGGVGIFAGFTTDTGFDRVRIYGLPPDPFGIVDKVFFDSFYFAAVPGPAGWALVAVAGAGAARRRRR